MEAAVPRMLQLARLVHPEPSPTTLGLQATFLSGYSFPFLFSILSPQGSVLALYPAPDCVTTWTPCMF